MSHADAQFDKELAAAYEELEKAQQKLGRPASPGCPTSRSATTSCKAPTAPSACPRCSERRRT